jgi:outer membrane protein OmpA-like peptidoglycan-associated protein
MMRYVIMQSAGQGSTASIKGSTDRLGELRYNVNLSTDRARAVEAYLRSVAPQVSIDSVTGVGPADLPYDNSLPEGRFYCRTVSLTITTPLR